MKKKLSTKQLLPKYKLDIRTACSYDANDLFIRNKGKNRVTIDYNVKLSNGKNLQRDFVWTVEQKRSLILSILKELQIPNFAVVIYRNEKRDTQTYKIIDGKQIVDLDIVNPNKWRITNKLCDVIENIMDNI